MGAARGTKKSVTRASVIQRTGRKCLRSGIVHLFCAFFDPFAARGGTCDAGDVTCRTRANSHALGLHGHFTDGVGDIRGALFYFVVARGKQFRPSFAGTTVDTRTAAESFIDGRAGRWTARSL